MSGVDPAATPGTLAEATAALHDLLDRTSRDHHTARVVDLDGLAPGWAALTLGHLRLIARGLDSIPPALLPFWDVEAPAVALAWPAKAAAT